jgi:hypothetical protein
VRGRPVWSWLLSDRTFRLAGASCAVRGVVEGWPWKVAWRRAHCRMLS